MKKIFSFFIVLFLLLCLSSKYVFADYYNVRLNGSIICKDEIDLSNIELELKSSDYQNVADDLSLTSYETKTIIKANKKGNFSFIAPSEEFVLSIILVSLPEKYGVELVDLNLFYTEEDIIIELFKVNSINVNYLDETVNVEFLDKQKRILYAEYEMDIICNDTDLLLNGIIDESIIYIDVRTSNNIYKYDLPIEFENTDDYLKRLKIISELKVEINEKLFNLGAYNSMGADTVTAVLNTDNICNQISEMNNYIARFNGIIEYDRLRVYYKKTGYDSITDAKANEVMKCE